MKAGYLIPFGESPELGRPPSYTEIRDLAVRAEDARFDSIWVYDHLLYRFQPDQTVGIWECWSLLSALAEVTSKTELGTLVVAGLWRNPALLAKMAVTVDEISGGRLILGLGTGTHRPEFDAFGYPFDHRASRFEEAMEIITSLLHTGKADVRGTYASAPDCELRPRGPRPGKPPILVASRGPRMLEITARYADAWNTAWYGPVDGIAEQRAKLEDACERVGRDPADIEITVGVNVFVAAEGFTPDRPEDPSRCLCGSPADIAEALHAYEEAGVGHVICTSLAAGEYAYSTQVVEHLADELAIYRGATG